MIITNPAVKSCIPFLHATQVLLTVVAHNKTCNNQDGSYQNHHRVYKRADEGCPRCGDVKVIRIVQAQRSTFYCPRCQRMPRSNSQR